METRGSMPHSQGLSINASPEPNQPNSSYWYLRSTLILSSHSRLDLLKGIFPIVLPVNISKAGIWSTGLRWKQTCNLCLMKITKSDSKRKIWTWTEIRTSDIQMKTNLQFVPCENYIIRFHQISREKFEPELGFEVQTSRAPDLRLEVWRFESRFKFKFFSCNLILWKSFPEFLWPYWLIQVSVMTLSISWDGLVRTSLSEQSTVFMLLRFLLKAE